MCTICLGEAGFLSGGSTPVNPAARGVKIGPRDEDVDTSDDFLTILTADDAFRWNATFDRGTAQVVTYRFYDWHNVPGTADQEFELVDDTRPMNGHQRDNMRLAVEEFTKVSGLEFVELGSNDDRAMVSMHMVEGSIVFGRAFFPDVDEFSGDGVPGDIILDFPTDMDKGTFGFLVALHELGHAVGLKHPFQPTGGNDLILDPSRDNHDNTVMSYTEGRKGIVDELRPLDVEALEFLYGEAGRTDDWTVTSNDRWITIRGSDADDDINSVMAATRVRGGGGDDRIYGSGEGDLLRGGDGEDVLRGLDGADRIYGGRGDDRIMGDGGQNYLENRFGVDTDEGENRLFGQGGHDRIFGGAMDDLLDGGVGHDHLVGWGGNDVLRGRRGDDELEGSGGNDLLRGGRGDDLLSGQEGADTLKGHTGRDRLAGGQGADALDGGGGADVLRGGSGDDALVGGRGRDRLFGGGDDDRLDGGGGADVLRGGSGDDVLVGGRNGDRLFGGRDDDRLEGGLGADVLDGGSGDDVLVGGLGRDRLVGGDGADTFVMRPVDARWTDVVVDWERADMIDAVATGLTADDLRLTQRGDDLLVEIGETALRLRDTDRGAFDVDRHVLFADDLPIA